MARLTPGQEPVRLRGSVEFSEKLFEYRRIEQTKRTLLEPGFSHKIDHTQCSKEEILVRMQPWDAERQSVDVADD